MILHFNKTPLKLNCEVFNRIAPIKLLHILTYLESILSKSLGRALTSLFKFHF